METLEENRLRSLELEMVAVKTLVGTMKDDVHAIRNAIVFGVLTLVAVLFSVMVYFVQQKDEVFNKLDRNYGEAMREHKAPIYGNTDGIKAPTPRQTVDN